MLKFFRKSQPCPSMYTRSISTSSPPELLSICLLLYLTHFMTPFLVDVTALLLPHLLHVSSTKNSQYDNPTKANNNMFLSPWISRHQDTQNSHLYYLSIKASYQIILIDDFGSSIEPTNLVIESVIQIVHHQSADSQRPQCYCITSPPRQHTKPNSFSLVPQPNLCMTWLSNSSPQSVLVVKVPWIPNHYSIACLLATIPA